MGTSTNYNAPPSWGDLKAEVTRAARGGPLTKTKAGDLVRGLIARNGGGRAMARGAGAAVAPWVVEEQLDLSQGGLAASSQM